MPITYVIDRFRQRMVTQAEGLVTFADLNSHLDAEARDRGVDLPELFDGRSATTDITTGDVRRLVQRVQKMVRAQPFGPTAIIVINDFAFGMARMFSILVERDGVAVEVFRDVESGSLWLDRVGSSSRRDWTRSQNDPRQR
jgi:hypothetical protein